MAYTEVPERFRSLYNTCRESQFPGTDKWPADHPIWDCYVAGYMSPRAAWGNDVLVKKAVCNLAWIWEKGEREGKYDDYIARWTREIESGYPADCRVVLNRFTVAKIAPKVTALAQNSFKRILVDSGKDCSKGIYVPMAGFGGIVRAARELTNRVEAYDINENFNRYYGWQYRDVLAQVVTTDKLVAVCPPFGTNTERWPGTPESMYYSFEDWCRLIREHVIAPDYLFIGPEKRSKNKCGLFVKSIGVQGYPGL